MLEQLEKFVAHAGWCLRSLGIISQIWYQWPHITKSFQTYFNCILYWALKADLWNFMFVINSKFCCGVCQDGLYAFGGGSWKLRPHPSFAFPVNFASSVTQHVLCRFRKWVVISIASIKSCYSVAVLKTRVLWIGEHKKCNVPQFAGHDLM